MDQVITLINSVGFPIVACIFVSYQNNKLNDTIARLTSTLALIDKRLEDLEELERSR